MDTWLLLRDVEHEGRRSYALYVLKSRGMAHSHEMREFNLTDNGIRLGDNFTIGLNSASRQTKTKRLAVKRAANQQVSHIRLIRIPHLRKARRYGAPSRALPSHISQQPANVGHQINSRCADFWRR